MNKKEIKEIAKELDLSPTKVKRSIAKLEQLGLIKDAAGEWQDYKEKRKAELEELWTSGHRLGVGKDGLLYDTKEEKFDIFRKRPNDR